MAIRHKTNGNAVDEMQDKITKLLAEYAETNDPETELELIRLYEKMTKFKKNCGICVAGRAQFIKSLNILKTGDTGGALTAMKASMTSVKVKLDAVFGKFKGK